MCKSLWNNLEYTTAEPITFSGSVDNMIISNTGNIVPLSCEAGSEITGFEAPVPTAEDEKAYFYNGTHFVI